MSQPKLKSLSSLHRGSEQLARLEIEIDLADLPQMLRALDTSDMSEAHLEDELGKADALAKLRADEAEAGKPSEPPSE